MTERQGLLFAIVGPPGVGKNEMMKAVLADTPNLGQLATATTRPPRSDEQHGRERLFVSAEEFQEMMAAGDLLEWQQVHGNLYGVPRAAVETAFAQGRDLIADIDVLGATYIRSLYPANVVLVFVQPPSLAELERRMRRRNEETEAQIRLRLKRVELEMAYAAICDYVIINDKLPIAIADLRAAIESERTRIDRGVSGGFHFGIDATILPVYGDELLCAAETETTGCPVAPVAQGVIPHQAALDALAEALGCATDPAHLLLTMPHQGSFIPPLLVSADADRQITLTYVYLLPERVPPPPGWAWQPLRDAHLPPPVIEALHEQRALSTDEE